MGWFSPLKGAYPSLGQVDKTLPVKGTDVADIKRGMILALKSDASDPDNLEGVFDVASATDKILYVALQDYTDPTAGFAGTAFDPSGKGYPCISGLSLDQEGEYQTSVFDGDVTYSVGDALYVGDGGVLTNVKNGDATLVGHVTSVPFDRWINNAIATPKGMQDQRLATRTGATMKVLCFKTK